MLQWLASLFVRGPWGRRFWLFKREVKPGREEGSRVRLGLQPHSPFQPGESSGAKPACFETPMLGGINQALVPSHSSGPPKKTTHTPRLRWSWRSCLAVSCHPPSHWARSPFLKEYPSSSSATLSKDSRKSVLLGFSEFGQKWSFAGIYCLTWKVGEGMEEIGGKAWLIRFLSGSGHVLGGQT